MAVCTDTKGAEVDEDEVFQRMNESEVLLLLRAGEEWHPLKTSQVSEHKSLYRECNENVPLCTTKFI